MVTNATVQSSKEPSLLFTGPNLVHHPAPVVLCTCIIPPLSTSDVREAIHVGARKWMIQLLDIEPAVSQCNSHTRAKQATSHCGCMTWGIAVPSHHSQGIYTAAGWPLHADIPVHMGRHASPVSQAPNGTFNILVLNIVRDDNRCAVRKI